MRKRHAREIRKGLLVAREFVRSRRAADLERIIVNMWELNSLEGLPLRAFTLTHRKRWKGLK